MKWDLEKRVCVYPLCGASFRVLPKSPQRHCSIPHNPSGPTTFIGAIKAAIKKRNLERQRRVDRMVGRIRDMYAQNFSTAMVVEKLNAEGYRKPRKGHRIDVPYLNSLRWKYKIRLPPKPKPG